MKITYRKPKRKGSIAYDALPIYKVFKLPIFTNEELLKEYKNEGIELTQEELN